MASFKKVGGIPTIKKPIGASLDYTIDWTDWLGTDIIASVAWVITGSVTTSSNTHTDKTATIWLTGGTLDETCVVKCTITTPLGRIEPQVFDVIITS